MKEGIEVENQYVCVDCGLQYLKEYKFPEPTGVSTSRIGKCCSCHEEKTVLHERNYRYLANWKKSNQSNK